MRGGDKKRVQVTDASGKTTVHKKLSGFDGTYIIARLDVSKLLTATGPEGLWLHVKQEKNKALMAAVGMTEGKNEFTDNLGTRTGSYKASDLKDKNGEGLYYDVILLSTGKMAASADAGKADAGNGDVPIQMYVDDVMDYNPNLKYEPTKNQDPNHMQNAQPGALYNGIDRDGNIAANAQLINNGSFYNR